ncbi:class I SAM-dependent methyltransferase [Actinosynnema sp. NPDC050436]|uniref:class I SAM-dependent methyltransferase n=1 Tax=Actinosynnema sp. NPDC050436 TaxID=3155659 RepID=UPI0033E70F20
MSTQDTTSHANTVTGPLTAREAFNGTVASSAVAAAFELGLLQELAGPTAVVPETFAAERKLLVRPVQAIASVLAHLGVATRQDDHLTRGPAFADVWRNKGYFLWLVGGYGRMLSDAAGLSRAEPEVPAGSLRDGAVIARAGRDYGARFVDPAFEALLAGRAFGDVADLGCGSADRLIKLATTRPGGRFLGVELNPDAVRVARAAVAAAGVADRVEIVAGDIAELDPGRFPGYDLVFSFFLGHDLWPERSCVRALDGIRRAFPDAGTFLLGDTYRSDHLTGPDTPIFTLGFEYTHALMGQHIPSMAEWRAVIDRTAWRLTGIHPLEIAHSAIFELAAR